MPKSYIQSVIIPKAKYSLSEANAWIKGHDFKISFHGKKVHVTKNYYRYRQTPPKPLGRYRVRMKALNSRGILAVMYYYSA